MSHSPASSELISLRQELAGIVGASHLREDLGPEHGAKLMALPASTEEVAALVQLCAARGVSIVPEGGGTGLVGGTLSQPGQLVISLTRMAKIEAIYPDERVAVVQAGVPLEVLQSAAALHGLEPGIDLPARGTATIGGMVSTNAGGIMAHRYGVMRHRVLGLEAVLPDGQIYSDLTRVVKNAAGYDLKHLFIGAEGTLGLVTRVVLKLEPLPAASATVLLGLPSFDAALQAINLAMKTEIGHLRGAEGLWQSYIRLTAQAHGWSEPSFPLDQPVNLLLMLGGGDEAALQGAIEGIFGSILEAYPSATGIIAASKRQEADLWRLREDTDVLYRTHKAAPSYDVSVPLSEIAGYVDHVTQGLAALDGGIKPYVFGHLADGNLHIVLDRTGPMAPGLTASVEEVLYAPLRALGGSFSAEHGVGSKRIGSLIATVDAGKLQMMTQLKRTLDPGNLLNPGKVLSLKS
ncbi:FAD-binding oxidoreductase [Xinfangfangia sp. CPCC 101601]|uniref:FAD-binding oxidoreductase n=1 Tax=Pseudogemmobacter lacusdianii TaxID=3069608 RepID=A0ABU0VWL7_9RHOB|nr:FAD-binding oxidoreductase [Xinfangfangia sp. CPCC 101601]MDQ2066023.1 FAD-binding oxidoreductase [Xinfangfangia sp. CPCC 101601]